MRKQNSCENDAAYTSNPGSENAAETGMPPEGPESSPEASLRPELWPPDWWRCLRFHPISGRYYGEMTAPTPGKYALDLRADIDRRHSNSPVMNRISGDIYRVYKFKWGSKTFFWRVYQESWIVDRPDVRWSRCSVGITGRVRYWKGIHLITDVQVAIPWEWGKVGPAQVKFTHPFTASAAAVYSCEKKSSAFRELKLEVDVCDSVNAPPVLPSYDTHAHPNRPVDLPQRTLTIQESYMEAGIDLDINPVHTNIDDSDPDYATWSVAELHDAMELYFSQHPGQWPKWHMWCLLAGTFDSSGVAGIMFDAAAMYGGAGVPPERQGCALFRNHSWFDDLVAVPTTDAEAAALRDLLYTYVHEMGHAFNFLHSWDKSRPDALSWMNYPWKYDSRNGADTFWANFRFRFDDQELIHLRHGDRSEVIPGGDAWATGWHMESPSAAMADLDGQAPVELLLRSKEYFHFMEPVNIEFRIRNAADLPLELDTRLHPEFGGMAVYIRRPDGRILQYAPILCKTGTPEIKVLKPEAEAVKGEDRHSENILLSYGTYGHYFNEPGEYLVRAFYHGAGDILIPSNLLRVRIGRPFTREEDRIAQDFFSYQAGMALYLNGSDSPFLEKGMKTLQDMADQFAESPVGAEMSLVLAQNLARPFFRIVKNKMVKTREANPEESLKLTERAMEQQKRDDTTFSNIAYHQLGQTRIDLMSAMDRKEDAKNELKMLVKYLKGKGVNKPVLDEIEKYAKGL